MVTFGFYLFKRNLQVLLLVLLVFFVLFIIIGFATEVQAVKGNYTLLQALVYVVVNSGGLISLVLPIIGLFSLLITMGSFASGSEIIAIQAGGMSYRGLVLQVFSTFFLLFCLLLALNEIMMPLGGAVGDQIKSTALNERRLTGENVWVKDVSGFVFVKKVLHSDKLQGVVYYELDDKGRLQGHVRGDFAHRINGEWVLIQAKQTNILYGDSPTKMQINRQIQEKVVLKNVLSDSQVQFSTLPPTRIFLWDLFAQIHQLKRLNIDNIEYEISFWYRVLSPLSVAGFIFLLLPVFIGSPRHTGVGERVFLGLVIGVPYFILLQASQYTVTAYSWPPAIAASVLPVTLLFVGLWRFFSVQRVNM